ncbi:glutathione S-transferase family protein [Vacuolonema iberomarrocanum]|uniref:glutathione S-transferase family protein n=1 Tax=Vacuolonema iberomarrocanum TaxID=3454632 RepID=UPI001A0D57B4|nr:glutathione S-transferase family protein [filamentous cyanobacterium LEGE 07170]
MLRFYYHPLSPISRRVWIALLEKALPFEPILVNLNGEQRKPAFLALNPFQHVPVLVDGDQRILESLAIMDYLEAKYPEPSLMPQSPEAIAQTRMVQLVTMNELTTKLPALVMAQVSGIPDEDILQHLATGFGFLQEQLGDAPYFGGDRLSLADITAGAAIALMVRLGVSLTDYPALEAWHGRIAARPSWQQTEPDAEGFSVWQRWVSLRIKRFQRQKART